MLKELDRLRLNLLFMEKGIVPMGIPGAGCQTSVIYAHDINRILATLPPDEARTMKRKFRKMWRAIVKRQTAHGGRVGRALAKETQLGAGEPTKAAKSARKWRVFSKMTKMVATNNGGV